MSGDDKAALVEPQKVAALVPKRDASKTDELLVQASRNLSQLDEQGAALAWSEAIFAMGHYGETLAERKARIASEVEAKEERESVAAGDVPTSDIAADLIRAQQKQAAWADQVRARLRELPCGPGIEQRRDDVASAACRAADAQKWCDLNGSQEWCPRARGYAAVHQFERRLSAAKVPAREHGLVAAGARAAYGTSGSDGLVPPRLWETPAMVVVRAILARQPATVKCFEYTSPDGKSVRGPVNGFSMSGRECMFALAGARGNGKTLAASWALAKLGGLYVTAYKLARANVDPDVPRIRQLTDAKLLVIDQTGREHVGAQQWGDRVFEEVTDTRYAEHDPMNEDKWRFTFFIGNFEKADLEVYDKIFMDRFRGGGVFVWFEGDSLR